MFAAIAFVSLFLLSLRSEETGCQTETIRTLLLERDDREVRHRDEVAEMGQQLAELEQLLQQTTAALDAAREYSDRECVRAEAAELASQELHESLAAQIRDGVALRHQIEDLKKQLAAAGARCRIVYLRPCCGRRSRGG